MEEEEMEAIVKNNIDSIMPIILRVYGNTTQWELLLDILENIDIQESLLFEIIAFTDEDADIYLTLDYFKQGPKEQQRTLLHELAHSYVILTDPEHSFYFENAHDHPEFIRKYAESLKLAGMPIKRPTAKKLEASIFTPTELPPKKWMNDEKHGKFNNYYCPMCQDIFTTTLEKFKKEHAHAFEL
jgi:hypothetical protein